MNSVNRYILKDMEYIRNWNVFFLSLWMSLGTVISRVFGLLRDITFTYFIPPGVLDEFVIAFKLPNVVRGFLGEGQFSTVFLPFYIEKKKLKTDQKFSSVVFSFLLVTSLLLVTFGMIFMEDILNLLLKENFFLSRPNNFFSLIWFARWLLLYTVFVVLFSYFSALVQEKGRFFFSSTRPSLLEYFFYSICFFITVGRRSKNLFDFRNPIGRSHAGVDFDSYTCKRKASS